MNYYRGCPMPRNSNPPMRPAPYSSNSPRSSMKANYPLAIAHVAWQKYENLYPEDAALFHGTYFIDLDLDFRGKRG